MAFECRCIFFGGLRSVVERIFSDRLVMLGEKVLCVEHEQLRSKAALKRHY